MSKKKSKREIALPCLIFYIGALAFLSSSMTTQSWISSKAEQGNASTAIINFGLFQGYKKTKGLFSFIEDDFLTIVCSLSNDACMFSDKKTSQERATELDFNLGLTIAVNYSNFIEPVKTSQVNPYLLSCSFWSCTVIAVCISTLFSVVGAIFAVVNSVMSPVEFVTGINGFHVWNFAGATFSTLALILWGVEYSKKLRHSVLPLKNQLEGWMSVSEVGFSFWLVLAAVFVFLLNSVFVVLITQKPWKKKLPQSIGTIHARSQEGIMLY